MKKLGVDEVYCLSVNDAFVMRQVWDISFEVAYAFLLVETFIVWSILVGPAPGPGGREGRRLQPPEPWQLQEGQAPPRWCMRLHPCDGHDVHLVH